jgi:hypothetical protein
MSYPAAIMRYRSDMGITLQHPWQYEQAITESGNDRAPWDGNDSSEEPGRDVVNRELFPIDSLVQSEHQGEH